MEQMNAFSNIQNFRTISRSKQIRKISHNNIEQYIENHMEKVMEISWELSAERKKNQQKSCLERFPIMINASFHH